MYDKKQCLKFKILAVRKDFFMNKNRVRFAPSPTGTMHIGNVRTALLNYLFALKTHGTFILRIEDTDTQRNVDPQAQQIMHHLAWLGITYAEGPIIGGPYAPYYQSERHKIYQRNLEILESTNSVYRCFCTQEELEIKRNRQIALKNPPRYDRTCLKLSATDVQKKLDAQTSFIWRMKIDETKTIQFKDLGCGNLTFDPKNFSDFALTRADGTFTFMFANCIDDIEMKVTHILRGLDHQTNTVGQIAIMMAMGHTTPIFWHLPILFNVAGKKLSKRDQGFSLEDLKIEGFLPEAIVNYLGIIGASFEQEILSMDELATAYNFDNMHTSNQIKYDIEKLRWVNHKWIAKTTIEKLVQLCKPFLTKKYDISNISDEQLTVLIQSVQTDITVLEDINTLLAFYFTQPTISQESMNNVIVDLSIQVKLQIIFNDLKNSVTFDAFFNAAKQEAQSEQIAMKDFFSFFRLKITGNPKGLGIVELEKCLGFEEIKKRVCL